MTFCEVCGAFATVVENDLIAGPPERGKDGKLWATWSIGQKHLYCAKHGGNPLKTVPADIRPVVESWLIFQRALKQYSY